LKSFIQNFDADGIVIKTRNKASETPVGDAGGNAVDQMAKRAAAKEIKT
jgi:hypothetical protein